MSLFEQQMIATEQRFDEQMRAIEAREEVLCSQVPDSRLHQKIHNPVDEGIDEG